MSEKDKDIEKLKEEVKELKNKVIALEKTYGYMNLYFCSDCKNPARECACSDENYY